MFRDCRRIGEHGGGGKRERERGEGQKRKLVEKGGEV